MNQHDEQEVARGLREGRADAWTALYDAYAGRVWRSVARRMGPDAAEVADVVQETFLAAARGARGFDPARGSLGSWLGGIARRQAALHYRNRHRIDQHEVRGDVPEKDAVVDWLACGRETPPAALQSAELRQAVRHALGCLPIEQETLLTSRYFDGLSIEQIADAEQTSPAAIRSRLARARKSLRRALLRGAPSSADGQASLFEESSDVS